MPEWVWWLIIGANLASTGYSVATIHRFYVRERAQQARWFAEEMAQRARWQQAWTSLAAEAALLHTDTEDHGG